MSDFLASRINKKKFKMRRSYEVKSKQKYIIGFDSEADTTVGRPMLLQFSLPNTNEEDTLIYKLSDEPNIALRTFLDFITKFCKNGSYEYLIYAWNTSYELTQLFQDLPDDVRQSSEFTIVNPHHKGKRWPWTIEVINFKRQMVIFKHSKNKSLRVSILDGMAFYNTSLNKAAKMLGLGEKYEMDKLSRTMFTREDIDNEDFIKYSKRDAYITRLVGEFIQQQHIAYKINTTISAPHFAATVFKTQFLDGDISHIPPDLEQAGLYSYHGGKNGFYLDGPSEFGSIYQYDITSAYPEAMKQLPNIVEGSWGKVNTYIPNVHALWQVKLAYNPCIWRGMQNHDGSWTTQSIVSNIWVTSYELDEMMTHKEVEIISVKGWIFDGPAGGSLSDYVDRFFGIKKIATGPQRETAKLLLNSLYGKFFQKQPLGSVGILDLDELRFIQTDPTRDYDWEAGGLYHPPIASLITGYVRAKIHRLEHKYESIMTSTDGIFAVNPPDPIDIGNDLGMLTVQKGRLRIWRERLYIFDGDDGKRKYALHGFHSNVADLEEIPLARGNYMYFGKQMITLKMSTTKSRGISYSAGKFVTLPYTLKI